LWKVREHLTGIEDAEYPNDEFGTGVHVLLQSLRCVCGAPDRLGRYSGSAFLASLRVQTRLGRLTGHEKKEDFGGRNDLPGEDQGQQWTT
jgi:hypothetical protein